MSNRIELGSRVLNSERGTTMLARMRDARKNESGFTLIELLIVIIILGVLAGIVVFSVSGVTNRGEVAACKATVKTVQVAGEAYYAQKGTYAVAVADLITAGFLQAPEPTGITYTPTAATATVPAHMTVTGAACP
jgi:prepilin-type N-terminal cleavage/methylation domain-containing protein